MPQLGVEIRAVIKKWGRPSLLSLQISRIVCGTFPVAIKQKLDRQKGEKDVLFEEKKK